MTAPWQAAFSSPPATFHRTFSYQPGTRATQPALASALHGFATGPRNTGGSPVVLIDIF